MMSNPYFAPIEKTMSAVTGLLNARKPDEDKIFGLIGAGLMMARLPSTSVTRAAAYNYHVISGEETPKGILDYLGRTSYGKKAGRSARFGASTPFTVVDDLMEE
jgi:hypothetical protein